MTDVRCGVAIVNPKPDHRRQECVETRARSSSNTASSPCCL